MIKTMWLIKLGVNEPVVHNRFAAQLFKYFAAKPGRLDDSEPPPPVLEPDAYLRRKILGALLTVTAVVGFACVGQPAEFAPPDAAAQPAEAVSVGAVSPLPTPTQKDNNAEEALLLWEGSALFAEDPAECHRLRLTHDHQAFLGLCEGKESEVEYAASTEGGLASMVARFAPFQADLPQGRITFNGQGEIAGPAWERAITTWAQFTYAELATGHVGAANRTVLAWNVGRPAGQPGQCQMLLVLAHGYATAGLTPCDGGQMQVLASGWIEPAEWEQFDTWLYSRAPVYQDNSYLDGRGTTEMSSAETASLAEWAKEVYAELSQTSNSPIEVPPALNLRQVLAQQLQTDVASVQIVSVEEKTWPDRCLGAAYADQLCQPQETPGYLIGLAVNGDQYIYHTDLDGQENRLVSAPKPLIGERLLAWSGSDVSGCRTVEVGLEGVAFGHCGEVLMGVPFSFDLRPTDIAEFAETYTSFEAETPVGTVNFRGNGATVATPAEQRMLAEWAQLVYLEAESGRSGASWGLVFAWHREGGLAGFCDDVSVYVTGQAFATSCNGDQPQDLGRTRLNADQLATIFNWVDTLQPFEQELKDPAQADAMTTRLVFSGTGSQPAHEADMALISEFAQILYNEVSTQAITPPARCLTPSQDQQLLQVAGQGYCLLYPAAYSVVQTNPNGTEIVKDTVMNHIDPRVSIEVQPTEGRSLQEVADQIEADYGAGFDIARSTITVDEVEAVVFDNLPGQDLNRRVVFIQNDRLYSLFFAPIGDEGSDVRQQAETLYQQVIDSFRFLETTGSTPSDESSESGLLPSDVQYMMAMADLNIRSGPGTGYPIIGSVFGGQIALITGATPDGQWWRVICPDDTVGDCFVIADPALTLPTAAPGAP